jgi:hypothetical protein
MFMSKIEELCRAALSNPNFKPNQPTPGTTHCNSSVNFIAQGMGCNEFVNLTADQIYQVVATNKSGKWTRRDASDATNWALSNGLAIAILPSSVLKEAHGHVAVVYPKNMELSVSLGRLVCMVANVGATVGVMRSSQAFPVSTGECEYYIWNNGE